MPLAGGIGWLDSRARQGDDMFTKEQTGPMLDQIKTDFQNTRKRVMVVQVMKSQGCSREEIEQAIEEMKAPDLTDIADIQLLSLEGLRPAEGDEDGWYYTLTDDGGNSYSIWVTDEKFWSDEHGCWVDEEVEAS
jgi:hypothetical protein